MLAASDASLNVLIVDDVPEICDLFRGVARRSRAVKLHIETLVDGEQAMAEVRTGRFDVVVSDFRMRGVDGIQVLQEALRTTPDGYRVLMTGYNEIPASIDRICAARIDAYVHKPLDMQELQVLFRAFASRDRSLIAEERAHARELETLALFEERA